MSDKLQLKEVLGAIDYGSKELWDELNDDQKKSVSFFILNRMCSFVKGQREEQELAVLKTNEYYNKNFFDIPVSKDRDHRKLLWQLACMSGNTGKVEYHPWVKLNKKVQANDRTKLIQQLCPGLGSEDINLLEQISTKDELIELARENGIDPPKLK